MTWQDTPLQAQASPFCPFPVLVTELPFPAGTQQLYSRGASKKDIILMWKGSFSKKSGDFSSSHRGWGQGWKLARKYSFQKEVTFWYCSKNRILAETSRFCFFCCYWNEIDFLFNPVTWNKPKADRRAHTDSRSTELHISSSKRSGRGPGSHEVQEEMRRGHFQPWFREIHKGVLLYPRLQKLKRGGQRKRLKWEIHQQIKNRIKHH